jgi:hypothetical protein
MWWKSLVIWSVAAIAVVGVLVIAFGSYRTIQCDGSIPTWMIDSQDYNGGGCAEILPDWRAPANADWTPYCLGMC